MNRLEEVQTKHDQLRLLLERYGVEGIWLKKVRNIAWFSGGADASISVNEENGAYSLLITESKRYVVVNNIEVTRLLGEEPFVELGFEFEIAQWYEPLALPVTRYISDEQADFEATIQTLRWQLTEAEVNRVRELGRDAAQAIEQTIAMIHVGDTEYKIASRLDASCRERGGMAVVNLVATDERINKYRHPLPTFKKLERMVMVVLCMRRSGLIVSTTRFAHVGEIPAELTEKLDHIAHIDASVTLASRPDRALNEVFGDLQQAYETYGETDQWQFHHQGGIGGYQGRERIANAHDDTRLHAHMMMAWNPSIVGMKSEDTILITENGFEVLTAHSDLFPTVRVELGGRSVRKAGIYRLE